MNMVKRLMCQAHVLHISETTTNSRTILFMRLAVISPIPSLSLSPDLSLSLSPCVRLIHYCLISSFWYLLRCIFAAQICLPMVAAHVTLFDQSFPVKSWWILSLLFLARFIFVLFTFLSLWYTVAAFGGVVLHTFCLSQSNGWDEWTLNGTTLCSKYRFYNKYVHYLCCCCCCCCHSFQNANAFAENSLKSFSCNFSTSP